MYAQCYQDLVDNCPNSDTFSTLGDAFMSIQVKKKKKNFEAFEKVLKKNIIQI